MPTLEEVFSGSKASRVVTSLILGMKNKQSLSRGKKEELRPYIKMALGTDQQFDNLIGVFVANFIIQEVVRDAMEESCFYALSQEIKEIPKISFSSSKSSSIAMRELTLMQYPWSGIKITSTHDGFRRSDKRCRIIIEAQNLVIAAMGRSPLGVAQSAIATIDGAFENPKRNSKRDKYYFTLLEGVLSEWRRLRMELLQYHPTGTQPTDQSGIRTLDSPTEDDSAEERLSFFGPYRTSADLFP